MASADTPSSNPSPMFDQLVPSQSAMLNARFAPTFVKRPPTTSFESYSSKRHTAPFVPPPTSLHEAPSHTARCWIGDSPELLKSPPAYNRPPHMPTTSTIESNPFPIGTQVPPYNCAMCPTCSTPMFVNQPAATKPDWNGMSPSK